MSFHKSTVLISQADLDADDQSTATTQLSDLDLLVTVSTTTMHIAAALGWPVVLLASKRHGGQWFWPLQAAKQGGGRLSNG